LQPEKVGRQNYRPAPILSTSTANFVLPYPVPPGPAPGQDGRLRLVSGEAVIAAVVLVVLTHR
jgi:hypothetical protein